GCSSSAYSTVISHEYGHYIAHQVIGVPPLAGAFHEGYADSLSMLVHDTDIIADDYWVDGRTPTWICKLSGEDIKYPACSTSMHINGMLLGLIWWDIYSNDQYPNDAHFLFAEWTMLSAGAAPPHDDSLTFPM